MSAKLFLKNVPIKMLLLLLCAALIAAAVLPAAGQTAGAAEKRYKPELVVQTGHSRTPESIVFSPDKRYIASASGRELILWDAVTGKQLRTLAAFGESGSVTSINFSPDSRILAVLERGNLTFRDVVSGRKIRILKSDLSYESISFTSDWSRFVVNGPDRKYEAEIWSYPDLQKIKTIKYDPIRDENGIPEGNGYRSVISPDGKKLALYNIYGSIFGDREVKIDLDITIYSFPGGKKLRTIKGRNFIFHPDSRTAALTAGDEIRLVDVDSGKVLRKIKEKVPNRNSFGINPLKFSPDGGILLFSRSLGQNPLTQNVLALDVKTWKKIDPFDGKKPVVFAGAFSADGELFAHSGRIGLPKVDRIDLKNIRDFFDDINNISVWNIKTGKLSLLLDGSVFNARSIQSGLALSQNGRYFAFRHIEGLELWDLKKGRMSEFFRKVKTRSFSFLGDFKFSPDSQKIFIVSGEGPYRIEALREAKNNIVTLFDVEKETEIWTNRSFPENIGLAAFGPDGKLIAISYRTYFEKDERGNILPTEGFEKTISFLDARTGKETFKIEGLPEQVGSFRFSPDGRFLAITFDAPMVKEGRNSYSKKGGSEAEKFVQVWDIQARRLIRNLAIAEHPGQVRSVAFSTDSKILAAATHWNLQLWNLKTGRKIKTLDSRDIVGSWFNKILFSPDDKKLAGVDNYRDKRAVIDIETGASLPLAENWGEWAEPIDQIVRAGGKRYRIKLAGTKIELVDPKTEKAAIVLFSLGKNDWAVVTPEGLFDASPGAMERMHFVVSDPDIGYEVIEFEQLKSRYYVPGLYQKLIGGEDLERSGEFTVALNPRVTVAEDAEDPENLNVRLDNRGGGIGRVEVRVNGGEITGDARGGGDDGRFDPDAATANLKIRIPAERLRPGENRVEVFAWNKEGDVRSRGVGVLKIKKGEGGKAARRPTFFAVVGGVSDYAGERLDLRFAAKDAEDMAVSLALGAKRLFCAAETAENRPCENVRITLLSTEKTAGAEHKAFTGLPFFKRLRPTKANFRAAFEEVGRKAQSEDVFVAYLAGHATAIKSDAALKESAFADMYLYATSEAQTLDKQRLGNPSERLSMISSLELADWFNRSRAEKEALILDTCAAGAAQADLTAQLARSGDGEQIKALDRLRERTGFYILMGSASDAVSYEANRFRQGLLTYSLLEAMSGARLRDDRFVDVEELFGYAEDRVETLAAGINGVQRPRYFKSNYSKRFDIGRLEAAERRQIPLTRPVPVILRPRLLDRENLFDSLNLSDKLIGKLRELSYRTERSETGRTEINYVPAGRLTGGFAPSGLYTVEGDTVRVELTIRQDEREIGRIRISASKTEVVEKIIAALVSETMKDRR